MKLQVSFTGIDDWREQVIVDAIKSSLDHLAVPGSVVVEVMDGDE